LIQINYPGGSFENAMEENSKLIAEIRKLPVDTKVGGIGAGQNITASRSKRRRKFFTTTHLPENLNGFSLTGTGRQKVVATQSGKKIRFALPEML